MVVCVILVFWVCNCGDYPVNGDYAWFAGDLGFEPALFRYSELLGFLHMTKAMVTSSIMAQSGVP